MIWTRWMSGRTNRFRNRKNCIDWFAWRSRRRWRRPRPSRRRSGIDSGCTGRKSWLWKRQNRRSRINNIVRRWMPRLGSSNSRWRSRQEGLRSRTSRWLKPGSKHSKYLSSFILYYSLYYFRLIIFILQILSLEWRIETKSISDNFKGKNWNFGSTF